MLSSIQNMEKWERVMDLSKKSFTNSTDSVTNQLNYFGQDLYYFWIFTIKWRAVNFILYPEYLIQLGRDAYSIFKAS